LATILNALGSAALFVGSVLFFLILLNFMVLVHELGHYLTAKRAGIKIEEFGFGFPPRIWSTTRGETVYSVNAVPLGGFVKMLGEEDPTFPRSFGRASRPWRLAVLVAGAAMNFILAIVLFSSAYLAGWPTPTQSEVVVMQVVAGLPADAAGLKVGDAILTLADQPVINSADLRRIAEARKGEPISIVVRRAGQQQTLQLTPRASWPAGEGPLGVSISDQATKIEPVSYPLPTALVNGANQTLQMIVMTFSLPAAAIQGLLPWDMVRPVGPVGIYSIATKAAEATVEQGWWYPILVVVASLSTGLGIANLLPIPGLDGGRILFVLIEAVRGRRISANTEGLIHLVGMAVLLSLVLAITFVDISSPIQVNFNLTPP
jgi:regulator of sigma E protease